MKDPQWLTTVAKRLVADPAMQPRDDETFCNVATQVIGEAMGYTSFRGLMANQIIDLISSSDAWSYVPMEKAQDLANAGTWVLATERGDVHGHVCTIIPGEMVRSSHWSCLAPVCVNVGKDVFMGKGINWAFQDIPKLYAWRPSL